MVFVLNLLTCRSRSYRVRTNNLGPDERKSKKKCLSLFLGYTWKEGCIERSVRIIWHAHSHCLSSKAYLFFYVFPSWREIRVFLIFFFKLICSCKTYVIFARLFDGYFLSVNLPKHNGRDRIVNGRGARRFAH